MNFEYTNTCTCTFYDEETGEEKGTEFCYGNCYEMMIEDFTEITKPLFEMNETMWWKIGDIKLWNRAVSGYAYADTPQKLIEAMSVNSMWTMSGVVSTDHIDYSLSHHDAPTGSSSSVYPISDDERVELGLY